jgi:hypothetical protein
MKKLIRMATPVMAMALLSGSTLFAHAQNTPMQPSTAQSADWNNPPAGSEQAKQGYRDGIEAAQLDQAAKRKIDAKASHLYVHPPVKGAARDEYRASFAAGYDAAVKHNSGM